MKNSTWRGRRITAGSIAAAAMVLAAPSAQARLDDGGAPSEPEPFVQGVTDFPSSVGAPQDDGVRTIQIAHRPDGFDWGDAGIGAGSALVIVLIAGGASLAARHRSRPSRRRVSRPGEPSRLPERRVAATERSNAVS